MKITRNGMVMAASPLDAILQQARVLCADSGLDPDKVGIDGKPIWLQFTDHARKLQKENQQSLDPMQLLKAIEVQDGEEVTTVTAPPPSLIDPLDDLQKLYEKGIASDGHLPQFSHAKQTDSPCVDPLEALRALEKNTPEPTTSTFEDPFIAFESNDPDP